MRTTNLAPLARATSIAIFLLFLTTSCGKNQNGFPSHSPLAEGEAKDLVENRKTATLRVRKQMEKMREYLAPYESLLKEILAQPILSLEKSENPLSQLSSRLNQTRYFLENSVQQLGKKQSIVDESGEVKNYYSYSTHVELPPSLCLEDSIGYCTHIEVTLHEYDQASFLFVSQTPWSAEMKPLAILTKKKNDLSEVRFDFSQLNWLSGRMYMEKGGCLLGIDGKEGRTLLNCEPQELKLAKSSIKFTTIQGKFDSKAPDGLEFNLTAEIQSNIHSEGHNDEKWLRKLQLTKLAGKSPKLVITPALPEIGR